MTAVRQDVNDLEGLFIVVVLHKLGLCQDRADLEIGSQAQPKFQDGFPFVKDLETLRCRHLSSVPLISV